MDLQTTAEWFKNVLQGNGYGLTQCQYERIRSLLEGVCVYYPEPKTDFMKITFEYETGQTAAQQEVRGCPQAIDVIPVCSGDGLKYIRPVMLLGDLTFWNGDRVKETWTAIHEICHLLSIGDYIHLKDNDSELWKHTYGINEYLYEKREGRLTETKFDGSVRVNEWINEYAVRHFVGLMKGEQIPPEGGQRVFNEIADRNRLQAGVTEEKFIGDYFSGKVEEIRSILLGSEFSNYDDLEKYILIKSCASHGEFGEMGMKMSGK